MTDFDGLRRLCAADEPQPCAEPADFARLGRMLRDSELARVKGGDSE